jgi:pSer/pThr/pTyr-binding forkhead associated (FHA) protein
MERSSTPIMMNGLRNVVREEELPGLGQCYIYDDGSHCPKQIDGEPVNPKWGLTKAGRPWERAPPNLKAGPRNSRRSPDLDSGYDTSQMSQGSTSDSAVSPVASSQTPTQTQQNGVRTAASRVSNEVTAVLALLPMNGTFERKQLNVPFFPDVLRIGRQTNAKTVPTPSNGFFDSKALSRQHAEVWAERKGKIWIRGVKSSNGTFVNGRRLSPENRDSEPQELRQHDTLELGTDIVSEDRKVIVHHKVSAKVEYVGIPGSSNNVLDLNFGDLDPSQNGGLLSSPISQPMIASRGRGGGSASTNGRLSATSSITGSQMNSLAQQRQMNFWMPLNVEHLVKTLSVSFSRSPSLT